MKPKPILIMQFALFLLLGISCEHEQDKGSTFGIKDFSYSDCKTETKFVSSKEKEHVRFTAVASKYLAVEHINSEFNCCPGKLEVNTFISNDTIVVNETEKEQGCKCICPYDLKYKIGVLEHGKYHVILKKMNSKFAEFDLKFDESTNETVNIEHKKNE